MNDRRAVGQRGEDLAADYLEKNGYRVLERNVRSRYGEIDIVAEHQGCVVFVEVRTVRSRGIMPEESIGRGKQRRIGALALAYLQRAQRTDADWRTDVLAIELEQDGRARRIEHIKDAVEER